MKALQFIKKFFILGLFVFFLVWMFVFNWSFVFKKRIVGEVVAAERVAGAMAVITNSKDSMDPQVFSFSIGIKDRETGEIFVSSTEDRQWAAVNKGDCVVAAYFPYPPWKITDKGMTSHNARLLRSFESCEKMPNISGVWEAIKFFFLIP